MPDTGGDAEAASPTAAAGPYALVVRVDAEEGGSSGRASSGKREEPSSSRRSSTSSTSPRLHAASLHKRENSSNAHTTDLLTESVDTIRETVTRLILFFTFKSTLEPNATAKVVWDCFILTLALYNFYFTSWYISFNTGLGGTLYGFDWFVTIAFWFDILITFRTGYIDYAGNSVFDAKLIAHRYAHSYLALDIFQAFPFHIFSPLIHFGPSAQFVDNCLKVNFILRSSKLVNSPRIDAFISPQARIGKLLFGFFCLAHLFGCIFFFVGSVQTTDVTWITTQNLQSKGEVEQYIASLYWALATMVTVGYGDIVPVTVYEQATVIPILMLSALVYASIFGSMHIAIETLTSTIRRYQSRMDSVKEFVAVYELPPDLQQKLYDYSAAEWSQTKGFETSEMLAHLPQSVRADIMMFINGSLIDRVPLFKQCSDRFLEAMILRMTSQVCLEGDFVFKEGDKSREMYFVRSGSCSIIMEVQGVDRVIAEVGSFSDYPFIGEIALLLGETRTASARASTKCVLSRLSQQDFFEVLSMFPEEENSLRETATLRLEQDIEREAKALRKREQKQQQSSQRQLISSKGDHESTNKSEDGDAVQMTSFNPTWSPGATSNYGGGSPDTSPAPTVVHSTRLSRLNSSTVRRSLFVAHGAGMPTNLLASPQQGFGRSLSGGISPLLAAHTRLSTAIPTADSISEGGEDDDEAPSPVPKLAINVDGATATHPPHPRPPPAFAQIVEGDEEEGSRNQPTRKSLSVSSPGHQARKPSMAEKYLAQAHSGPTTPPPVSTSSSLAIPHGGNGNGNLDALAALRKNRDGLAAAASGSGAPTLLVHTAPSHVRSKTSGIMSRIVAKISSGAHASPGGSPHLDSHTDEAGLKRVPSLGFPSRPSAAAEAAMDDKFRAMEARIAELTAQMTTMAALLSTAATVTVAAPQASTNPLAASS